MSLHLAFVVEAEGNIAGILKKEEYCIKGLNSLQLRQVGYHQKDNGAEDWQMLMAFSSKFLK